MNFINLEPKPSGEKSDKLNKQLNRLHDLINALKKKEIPEDSVNVFNTAIHNVNHFHGNENELTGHVRLTYRRIHDYALKELNLVPTGYYQRLWIALGMCVFGIPLGAAMGTALGNVAFSGTGIAMGLPIGIAIGQSKDKKAAEEGRQLDIKV